MENIIVSTPTEKYPICFKNKFDDLINFMSNFKNSKVCILTDLNVEKLYVNEIKEILKDNFEVYVYSFEAGEKSKNLDKISEFYKFFLENHFDRKSVIIGLGGGVVGDMAGFSAATYMRGVNFIQIPTTLLAQVDSSVGGKVGVDFSGTKNIIGAFYQPKFVYINVNTLKSLPDREFSAGMAEVIKYGMIMSKDFYNYIKENKKKIKDKDEDELSKMIKKCCEFKAEVVSKDEKEKGMRAILNFGHTIGHSVESLKEFELIHGECVGIGMVAALKILVDRGILTQKELNEFEELLLYFNIPIKTKGIKVEDVYNQMFLDKKVSNNKINFVLLEEIGKAYISNDINKSEFLNAINYIL